MLFFYSLSCLYLYTLSLHDALPILVVANAEQLLIVVAVADPPPRSGLVDRALIAAYAGGDRKSTRLNSSHVAISYAVFCLKKKKHTVTEHSIRMQLCNELLDLQVRL